MISVSSICFQLGGEDRQGGEWEGDLHFNLQMTNILCFNLPQPVSQDHANLSCRIKHGRGCLTDSAWFCLHFFCCLSLARLHSPDFQTRLDWSIDSLLKCSVILWTGTVIPAAHHCRVSGAFWYYTFTPELRAAGEHWLLLLKVNKPVLGIVSAHLICETEVLPSLLINT